LTGRVTLPERMQRVQTFTVRVVPLMTAFIVLRLGIQRVLVLMFECEIRFPAVGFLLQNSHARAMA
jgi:hypothetical protein